METVLFIRSGSLDRSRTRVGSSLISFSIFHTALPKCDRVMDVSFLLDSSESVGLQNYQKLLDFVRKLAKTLRMSQSGTQASVVIFSDTARVQIGLDDHDDIREFNKALDDVPYLGKKTRIDKALQVALVGVFNSRAGMRAGVRRVAVLMTEGHQTRTFDAIPLRYAVEPLRRKRVDVFTVGIGSDARYDELRSLTNSDQKVLLVKTFEGLSRIAEELSDKMCRGMYRNFLQESEIKMTGGIHRTF